MDFLQFAKETPELYGQITVNGKSKIGSFVKRWDNLTNSAIYQYHTPEGNKGFGGLTIKKAYALLQAGRLSTNPEMGKPENYL